MKKVIYIITILMFSFTLGGCDSEIHDRMIIRGVGVDYDNGIYEVSVRVEDVLNKSENNMKTKGETVYDALTNLSLQSGSRQMYADSYFIIFGKSMAEEGIEKAVDLFVRYFKTLPTEQIFITDGKAEDIFITEKDNQLVPSSVIKDLKNSGKNSGKAVSVSLLEILSDTMSPSCVTVIPQIDTDGEKLILSGAYLLKNLKPIDKLNNSEIESLLIAKGEIKTASLVCENDIYGKVSLELTESKVKTDVEKFPDKIILNIEITAFITSVSPLSPEKIINVNEIEKYADEKIKENINQLISKCYQNNCDVLGVNYMLNRNNKDVSITENEYEFVINVKTNINKTGHEGDNLA